MQPRYSPNGRWIASRATEAAATTSGSWTATGQPKQVSKETFRLLNQPSWSPDSEYIVARKHFTSARSLGAGEMWMYHRAGGDGVQLTKKRTEQKDSGEPAFSPDGRYLYFSDDATPGDRLRIQQGPQQPDLCDPEAGSAERRARAFVTGPGGSIRPTPSPDGKSPGLRPAGAGQVDVLVLDLASGTRDADWDGLDRDMQETWAVPWRLSGHGLDADSRSLVLWAGGKIAAVDVGHEQGARRPVPRTDRADRCRTRCASPSPWRPTGSM
jgi:Tol biopolymer transport system component